VRGIVLKGVGIEALWPEVLALVVFALIVTLAASRRFRKRLECIILLAGLHLERRSRTGGGPGRPRARG
jgi:hypothetical protein